MNFFDNPLFNIAIAIIISWALFAVLCNLVLEAFAQIKGERGRFMKKYLLQQLQDAPNGINWASLLYMHGNIDLLSRAPGKPSSDIDPHLFAETLVDVVANAHIVQMQPSPQNLAYVNKTLADFKKATQTLLQSDVMMLMTQAIKSAEAAGGLDEGMIYKKLIENIEKWHTEFTQRLTLWYKKKTRAYLFGIGIVLALLLNVDSVQLFGVYKESPAKVQQIISFYNKNASQLQSDTVNLKIFLNKADELQKQTVLPVGFDSSIVKAAFKNCADHSLQTYDTAFWIWKIIGILITGFAASFGGPFWFDLLRKFYSAKS